MPDVSSVVIRPGVHLVGSRRGIPGRCGSRFQREPPHACARVRSHPPIACRIIIITLGPGPGPTFLRPNQAIDAVVPIALRPDIGAARDRLACQVAIVLRNIESIHQLQQVAAAGRTIGIGCARTHTNSHDLQPGVVTPLFKLPVAHRQR